MKALSVELNIPVDEMAYVGDDWPDLPAIRMAGLGVAVANAHRECRRYADFVTMATGGRGAVREVCDLLLRSTRLV
jgi:3-deoxy-D-manno-octulosonate 8-phosphate phosphatase (KDO 8-P phosphatase)